MSAIVSFLLFIFIAATAMDISHYSIEKKERERLQDTTEIKVKKDLEIRN
jgi:hypothetical protein